MTRQRSDQRLSKELPDTTGCEPAIAVSRSFCSVGCGFAATFGSLDFTGAGGFAAGTTGLAFGFDAACLVGAGEVLAVVSEPPRPILRARLEKKPSEPDEGADATRTGALAAGCRDCSEREAADGDEGAPDETYSPP
jgi:hypothetical protein